jgi:hypothetical protein
MIVSMSATPNPHALNLIRSEYLEMPGLALKPQQVQRLCGVDQAACQLVLDALVDMGFLTARHDGAYARRTGDDAVQLRAVKASLLQPATSRAGRLRNSA